MKRRRELKNRAFYLFESTKLIGCIPPITNLRHVTADDRHFVFESIPQMIRIDYRAKGPSFF